VRCDATQFAVAETNQNEVGRAVVVLVTAILQCTDCQPVQMKYGQLK